MRKNYQNFTRSIVIALFLAVMLVGVAWAYTNSVVLHNYTIDFLGVEEVDDDTTRWTYAVTEDVNGEQGSGLSHWTLGLGLCGYQIENPEPGTIYTTIDNLPECADGTYNCAVADYEVVQDDLGTVDGLYGIKFEFNDVEGKQLEGGFPPETHIFQFDLRTESGNYLEGDTDALIKIGGGAGNYEIGLIHGPVCPSSAVNLVSFGSTSNGVGGTIGLFALVTLVVVGSGSIVYSRRRM